MSTIELATGEARATIALRGAELVSWRVGGRDLLWSKDPRWWGRTSPILFPIVGWARNHEIRVDGRTYPMGVHGFAAAQDFTPEAVTASTARFILADNDETRTVFPFRFRLAVVYILEETVLSVRFEVDHSGNRPLPYALGLHPGFSWPFAGNDRDGHSIVFEKPERPEVPVITPGGLFSRERRSVPLDGRSLSIDDELFAKEALCFLDAQSRSVSFVGGGHAITIEVEDFPHIALWTKPGAPFLSIESWTGYGDPHDFEGEISDKPSMRLLEPGQQGRHGVRFIWQPEEFTP